MDSAKRFEEPLREAIARLAKDGIIAYPTETVWGLGACADRPIAVERLLAWKGRASDSPLAVLVPDVATAESIGCELGGPVRRLIDAFWPGPLMIVVPCARAWAPEVARADGALGLRCSPHPLAASLARAVCDAGLAPLTSTSLNRSGEPPAQRLSDATRLVQADLASEVPNGSHAPLLVSAATCDAGGDRPSTVVDCTGPVFSIQRAGAIAGDAIDRVWRS
jgi:L-threonylcarbamoyladenylate synthase